MEPYGFLCGILSKYEMSSSDSCMVFMLGFAGMALRSASSPVLGTFVSGE